MHQRFDSGRGRDIIVFLLLLALFLLASPFRAWWATPESPWHLPYLIWGGIIGVVYLVQRDTHHDL